MCHPERRRCFAAAVEGPLFSRKILGASHPERRRSEGRGAESKNLLFVRGAMMLSCGISNAHLSWKTSDSSVVSVVIYWLRKFILIEHFRKLTTL